MKKKIILIITISITLLNSCTLIKIFSSLDATEKMIKIQNKQIDKVKIGSVKFIYKDSRILMPVIKDNNPDTLIFDTGNTFTLFEQSNEEPIKDSLVKMHISGAFKPKYMYVDITTNDISNDIILWKNHLGIKKYIPSDNCSNNEYKVFGMASFENSVISINFDNNEISVLDSVYATNDFKEVKSHFDEKNGIYLYLKFDSKEEKVLFDTGCPITMFKEKFYKNKKDTDTILYGALHNDIDGNILYKQKNIISQIEIEDYGLSPIIYAPKLTDNLLGMSFIQNFNWIIDYKNDKIFLQKRKSSINPKFNPLPLYNTKVIDDNLVITLVNLTKKPKYDIGTKIKKVNNEIINKDNICHYMSLLNSTIDWSEFNLEVEYE
ncbi:MAG: hypothetical protein LBM25_01435 [Bacteroidales bacterium]|jgi:hypothetical protein|nr:hypothetical protein [Bacteroidales bacterium]